ncbi:MAG: TfoX/Sxy family protein [Candidatus Syntrophosphaera sp.]|nr:TfoX/Sxy family protein [Candidatus Syntrophosphaera sp.]
MATQQETVDLILERIQAAWDVSARKMFGEYGVYCDGKVVALVCDDQLFVKPTAGGRAFIGEVEEAPPYPGGKDWFLISEGEWDEPGWLADLVRITARELPVPKPKKGRKK